MKATHNKDERALAEYPKLMRSHKLIVLFTRRLTGIVVHGDDSFPIGYYNTSWSMDMFQPLPSIESVTLQND